MGSKTRLILFFEILAFFVFCLMLMKLGLQKVHRAPVINSAIIFSSPIEMREASQVSDHSYLKAIMPQPYVYSDQEKVFVGSDHAETIEKKSPLENPEAGVSVLVKKRVQGGLPFVSVSISQTFKKNETVNDPRIEEDLISENLFTIQLVTYQNFQRAEQEVEMLSEKGLEAFIIPSGSYFQVCINRFTEKDDALHKLTALKQSHFVGVYQDAYVRNVIR